MPDIMDPITAQFINPAVVVLILVFYILGIFLKKAEFVKDKYIPLLLLVLAMVLASIILHDIIEGIVQGTLVTAVAVLGNNLWKQWRKDE